MRKVNWIYKVVKLEQTLASIHITTIMDGIQYHIYPDAGVKMSQDFGYSQSVSIPASARLVFASGQGGWDSQCQMVTTSVEDQVKQALRYEQYGVLILNLAEMLSLLLMKLVQKCLTLFGLSRYCMSMLRIR